ncbi:MAG: Oxysterol binding protein [Alyxoria varia]|nr:MAG: Oxysterol binding protein [Alyxoria varia]
MSEGEAVPAQAKGSWSSFLKSLASFNGDLSSMTAPPFILSSTSLTEYSSYWAEHPSVFVAPAEEQDPQKRALLVLKWFLTTLKQQYSSRSENLGSEKKPLNPFLGEVFLGKWEDETGETQLISEQVSHHPPVTAYCIRNKSHGVRLQGYNGQKASFSKRIDVKQVGHALLHLEKYNETYLITLPFLHIEGLWVGAPFVELNGKSYINSSSGYTAKIDYTGRGWLSGKKNTFAASLYPQGKEKETLYTVDGQWTGEFTIKDAKSKSKVDTWNGKTQKTSPFKVASIEEQDELESRRAWRKVADALAKGDMNATSNEKSLIENSQRELRKKEQAEGKEWESIFFSRRDNDEVFAKLGESLGERLEADRTNGVWRYDESKAEAAKSPYRPGVMPTEPKE